MSGGLFLGAYATVEATLGIYSELLKRHRRVLPDWVALYYKGTHLPSGRRAMIRWRRFSAHGGIQCDEELATVEAIIADRMIGATPGTVMGALPLLAELGFGGIDQWREQGDAPL